MEKRKSYFIEDQAFVGSNTNFVAPVKIGKGGAYIGAGSTITKDVPPGGALALARGKQKNLVDWCQKKIKGRINVAKYKALKSLPVMLIVN